jgi:hypothetical protein
VLEKIKNKNEPITSCLVNFEKGWINTKKEGGGGGFFLGGRRCVAVSRVAIFIICSTLTLLPF